MEIPRFSKHRAVLPQRATTIPCGEMSRLRIPLAAPSAGVPAIQFANRVQRRVQQFGRRASARDRGAPGRGPNTQVGEVSMYARSQTTAPPCACARASTRGTSTRAGPRAWAIARSRRRRRRAHPSPPTGRASGATGGAADQRAAWVGLAADARRARAGRAATTGRGRRRRRGCRCWRRSWGRRRRHQGC